MAIASSIIALSSYNVPSSQASAYVIPAGVLRFRIDQASVTNYTGSDRTLTVYLLQSGESVANLGKAIDALNIPANKTVVLYELIGRAIETAGIINAFSSTATALSLSITGTNTT